MQVAETTVTVSPCRVFLSYHDSDKTRANLATALHEYRRAAELFEQVLADRQRILGPEHPDTLHILGEFERADERFKQGKSTQPE